MMQGVFWYIDFILAPSRSRDKRPKTFVESCVGQACNKPVNDLSLTVTLPWVQQALCEGGRGPSSFFLVLEYDNGVLSTTRLDSAYGSQIANSKRWRRTRRAWRWHTVTDTRHPTLDPTPISAWHTHAHTVHNAHAHAPATWCARRPARRVWTGYMVL